ncbi:MAG: GDP-mannose 4,6-dehydratase [Bacteroidales bacterium]|jgi:UDP-glucuronate 4-epimerase|nr:NAD-dependent epimerase/dehydratase family protein [Bacteroidales bacterium]
MINQKILITGAAGFIGSSLADDLLAKGFSIMGIDNFDSFYTRDIKETNISNALKHNLYSFQEGDIRDMEFLNSCFSGFRPDIVIHLAAKAGVRPSIKNPASYYDVNVNGTLNMLEAMRKNKIGRMLFASSSSVYGNNKKIPFAESDNVDFPVSPYAASKKACELLCHTYHHLFDMDIFCLRFFTVYGPRQRPDLAINKFTRALLNDEPITLFGDGSTSRDYTHISDILQGIGQAMENLKGFGIFNLGESNAISLKELVALLENSTGKKADIKYLPMQDGDVLRTFADISRAKSVLGYNPVVNIADGISNYVEWVRVNNRNF